MALQNTSQMYGIISAVIGIAAIIPYYVDILRGRTKPQRAAYAIFSILATISFFGQLSSGANASLWFAGVLMLNPYVIFVLSIKRGTGGLARKDKASVVLAGVILVAWYITASAALAVVLVVAANTIAKLLVAIKVYEQPYSDLLFSWVMSIIASIFAALAVGTQDFILLLPPIQNAVTVGLIASVIVWRRKKVLPPAGWNRKSAQNEVAA